MDLKKICRGCFQEKPEAGGTCPYCGFDEIKYERKRDPEVLPLNSVLQGKYVIGRCLGRGGFGITYLGWHMNLETVVAIKEFFPSGIVSRDTANPDRATRSDVTMVNTGSTKAYRKSLDGFIKEAKTLGGLRLPGVVLVHDFFEENRTAYIVMDYVKGENLSLWLKHSGGKLPEALVLKLIRPLTGSLQKLHEKGIIHRDISPDNLILQPDGSIMLVDFGAARTVVLEQEAEKAVQSMTVVLKPGYAPIEQYSSHGHQGPWTDVYAFCATIFRMLTGAAPADPSTRAVRGNDEEILRANLESARVSQGTINALMKGIQLLPQNRYQDMRELEEALYGTEETGKEPYVGGSGTQQPQAGQGAPEKKAVKTDGSSERDTVSHTTQTGGQGNSGRTGDEGSSHPSGPLGKKTNKGLIVVILAGVIVLIAAAIGFTVHSRNNKRQEVTERVSEPETQKVQEKESEPKPQEVSVISSEVESQEESERTTEELAQEAYAQGLAAYEDENYEKAVEWFEKAAALGSVDAMYSLGVMYYYGNGVEQEYNKAVEWYEKAADLGSADAMYSLGVMYYYGNGVEQEYNKAVEWYEKAADLGNAFAMNVLGIMYDNGQGVEQNYEKAVEWYEKAVDLGDLSAMYNLGIMYENGKGVEQNYEKAKELYEKAAEQGDTVAMYRLGQMYEEGNGVEQDYEKAKEWYEKAAALGFAAAQESIERLSEAITEVDTEPEQVNVEFDSYDVGDTLTFGTYEQDNISSNGKEPIEWLVLEKEDDRILVISKYGLDAKAYYEDFDYNERVTWEKCTLRDWLNDEFYQSAFNDEEREMIAISRDTKDKVFLLSIAEAESFFPDNESRKCSPTAYAASQGGYVNDGCWWWLRSTGSYWGRAAEVGRVGGVFSDGCDVSEERNCVRPALWIKRTS